jgi:photosystem II stability/assembly factor-like uncharacterized protein
VQHSAILAPVAIGAFFILGAAAAAPEFLPPSEMAATPSALAQRAPMQALARAGQRLVAAGQRGQILVSDDGRQWRQAAVPVGVDLTALSFPTARSGWAVGHEGVILHSADGGATWRRQLDGAALQALAGLPQGAPPALLDVWFEDEQKGYVVGAFNLLLRTVDGGRSWQSWGDRTDNPHGFHLYGIRPAGGGLFIVGEQGLVLKLDASGRRFKALSFPYHGTLFGITGTPALALAFGLRGNAWRSTDGGTSWSRCETGVQAGLAAGTVRADGAVMLASQAGHLLLSGDGGASFQTQKTVVTSPAYAIADAGGGRTALAGIGGVRVEAPQPAAGGSESRP